MPTSIVAMPVRNQTMWRLAVAAAVALGALLAFLARFYLLDDSLIHVRAANLLLHVGFPTADGVTRSFADSSPAFLALVAMGFWLTGSLYVPKALSLVAYGGLVLLLGTAVLRERRPGAQLLKLGFLLLLVSPFAVRWLTDGMETSLAVLFVLLLSAAAPHSSPWRTAALACFCVLIRVELTVVIAVFAAGEWLRHRTWSAAAAVAGGLAALAVIFVVFGFLSPDAAIAKARGDVSLIRFVVTLVSLLGGAGLFGVGLTLAWLGLTVANVTRLRRSGRIDRAVLADLLGIAVLSLVLLAAFLRGQALEGIRPLLPFFAFSLVCAVRLFCRQEGANEPLRWKRYWLPVAAAAAVLFIFDWSAFARLVDTQAQSLAAMRAKDWSAFRGHTILAWDVGYLAYFSGMPVCDVQGLINGRRFARLTLEQRLDHCARVSDFAYVDDARFPALAEGRDIDGWRVCDKFLLAKRSEVYWAYLLANPIIAAGPACPRDAPTIGRLRSTGL